jgi:hypothetical protein
VGFLDQRVKVHVKIEIGHVLSSRQIRIVNRPGAWRICANRQGVPHGFLVRVRLAISALTTACDWSLRFNWQSNEGGSIAVRYF